ncbi:hypothetical protein Tsubulata_015360 [Turnera subulata]|uniref:Sec1 family domain-containing protein MIP3 n=1 Tax=Turnera subulata TaxID=218843 RepID=A0A9Q0G9J5_9ROSI|nr:hypothetical protein Tsubulata_015360 [Turnera subulata]
MSSIPALIPLPSDFVYYLPSLAYSLVSEYIEGAIVYLDSGCTESFQFLGAFPTLLELGAKAVCCLENLGSLDTVSTWWLLFPLSRYPFFYKFDMFSLLRKKKKSDLWCWHVHLCYACVILPRYTGNAPMLGSSSECIPVFAVCAFFTCTCCLSLSTAASVSSPGKARCIYETVGIRKIAHSVYPDSPLGPDAFHEYESLLLQDYEELVNHARKDGKLSESLTSKDERVKSSEEGGRHPQSCSGEKITYDGYPEDTEKNMFISVRHFPMILCPLSPRVFVLPSQGSVGEAFLSAKQTDSLSPGLPSISTGLAHDGDDVPPGALLTAHFLYHLAAKMDLKMEIFSFGDLSKTVGKMMTDMSSLYDVGRRKRSAGLLLIDRTLDLLTPCCHGDSLVDCMFSSLPRRENKASYSVTKDSQAQLKLGHKLQRAPLDVQIPLAIILSEGEAKKNGSLHLENIEAFLAGWDSYKLAPEVADMSNLTNKTNHEKPILSENQLFDGSFVSTEAFRGTPYIEAILDRSTKDGAVLVKKWLLEALRRENVTVNVKPRSGVAAKSELLPMIKALAKNQSSLLKNKGIIQLAAALLVTLVEPQSIRWDAFMSAEKILTASAVDTSQSLAAQIGDLINKSALVGLTGQKNSKTELSEGLLSFQDALLLMTVGYILAGENFPTSGSQSPFSWQEEHFLKEAIVDAILGNVSVANLKFLHGIAEELEANLKQKKMEDITKASPDEADFDDFDVDEWGEWGDEKEDVDENSKEQAYNDMQLKLELRDRVDTLFKFLQKLSTLKGTNVPLREGAYYLESSFSGDLDSRKSLVYKLLTTVLRKHDLPGLEYHSSTVGRLFKSGFGRFGLGQTKPSLADQNVIMVFVIGGINGIEICEAQEALSESGKPDIELILGGTTLLTADDMFDLLLGNSSYL